MKKQQGFSLIELLVVLGIIGALTAIAIPQYQKYQDKAKVTAAIATLTNMRSVVEAYVMEKGEFPTKGENEEKFGIPKEVELKKDNGVAGTMEITVEGLPGDDEQKVVLTRGDSGGWTCKQPSKTIEVNGCPSEDGNAGSDTNNG
ncbi:pilin [Salinivibrio costicola]|uniref:Pilin n=1 Tax=Salinivibrio costicola TaxID=51367 RepID=A0ABX6K313_SALCS|nr:pilin [Salinivibrio costicola]QIR05319.1 pilin [Salinivibrio costicola]